MLYRFAKWLLRPIFGFFYNIKLEGLENLPEKGPLIICSNHTSAIDPIMLGVMMPYKRIYSMAKAELFRNKLIGWLMYKLYVFPVKRGEADLKSIKTSLKVLKDGEIMGIFPEGTRNRTGEVKAEPGVAMIAVKAHAQVLPVAIISNYKFFNKTILRIGNSVNLEEYYDQKLQNEDYHNISLEIMQKINEMSKG